MVGCTPLLRGYKGVILKAAFNLLVLAVESFIQIKQLNSEVIVQKQLLILLNELCGIKLDIHVKENMLEQVMAAMTVSLIINVAGAINKRCLMWTTYNNLVIQGLPPKIWFHHSPEQQQAPPNLQQEDAAMHPQR
jgi:hypothetical protein